MTEDVEDVMTTQRTFNLTDLVGVVDWEGGILASLEYGITSDQIEDVAVRELWMELEGLYGPVRILVDRISGLMGY